MSFPPGDLYVTAASREIADALAQLDPREVALIAVGSGLHIVDPAGLARGIDAKTATYMGAFLAAYQRLRGAIDSLTTPELAVLRTLWRRGPRLKADAIAGLFGGLIGGEELRGTLNDLISLGLVLPADRKRGALFVPQSVCTMLLGRSGGAYPASELLEARTVEPLRQLCVTLGLGGSIATKAERIKAIVAELSDQTHTRERIAVLPERARELLDVIVQLGGNANQSALRVDYPALFPAVAPKPSGRRADGQPPDVPDDPLTVLERQGLVLRQADWNPYSIICDEVMAALLPPWRLSAADFTPPRFALPPADLRGEGGQPTPLLDVVECLQFVDEFSPSLTQKDRFSIPDSKRLARRLSIPEPVYADFMFALTLAIDLLKLDGQKLSVRAQAARKWLQLDEFAQTNMLFLAWNSLADWRDGAADPYERAANDFTPPTVYRQPLADVFGELPQQGATLASIAAALRFHAPGLFPDAGRAGPAAASVTPDAWVRGVIRSLAWLGLAEPLMPAGRGGANAEPAAVRLTALALAVQQRAPGSAVTTIPRTDRLVVQPTLDVLAPPNIEPAVYRTLRRFTEPRSAGGMRTVTLSAASIRRALDRRTTLASMRTFLQRHSDAPVPGTVEALLGDVQAKHGRIRMGQASYYLTVDDPHLLTELQSDKKLADLRFQVLSPTVALIQGENLNRLLDKVRAAGHMPVVDDGGKTPIRSEGNVDDADEFSDSGPIAPSPRPRPALTLVPRSAPARRGPATATEPVRGRQQIESLLQRALDTATRIEMEYRARSGGFEAKTVRKVDVTLVDPDFVYGYCHLRKDDREFRIKRISWVRLTGEASG